MEGIRSSDAEMAERKRDELEAEIEELRRRKL